MAITNIHNLPQSFVDFARDSKYSAGSSDITVTTLIDAPRVNILRQANAGQLDVDVMDMIWPLFGTAVHHVLEGAVPRENTIHEERVYAEIGGWKVGGQIDQQEIDPVTGLCYITDYKVTSVWSVIFGKDEWVNQQNAYGQLVRMSKGLEIGGLRICAILRDWSRRDAQFKPDYPKTPVVMISLPVWGADEALSYLEERVALHQQAQQLWDTKEAMVECSDEERWTKPTTWAVVKKGNQKATRVFSSEKDANDFLKMNGPTTYEVQKREGERTRCEHYCSVSEHCTQFAMDKYGDKLLDKL